MPEARQVKMVSCANLGKKCISLSDAAPTHEILRKIYFVVKRLKKGLNRGLNSGVSRG